MKLFEAGILEKITNAEYEKMFKTNEVSEEEEAMTVEVDGIDASKISTQKRFFIYFGSIWNSNNLIILYLKQ